MLFLKQAENEEAEEWKIQGLSGYVCCFYRTIKKEKMKYMGCSMMVDSFA